jgi:hypothetical protein
VVLRYLDRLVTLESEPPPAEEPPEA